MVLIQEPFRERCKHFPIPRFSVAAYQLRYFPGKSGAAQLFHLTHMKIDCGEINDYKMKFLPSGEETYFGCFIPLYVVRANFLLNRLD